MQSTHLPASWVESLFGKLAAMYGDAFARKWDGVAKPELIAMWAEALGPYADEGEHRGQRIKWALMHLRDNNPFPPSLPEFVALVKQAPRPQAKALPAPKLSPEDAAPKIAEVARKIASPNQDFTWWAKRPPAPQFRAAWGKALTDLVYAGDERFRPLLEAYVESGVIASERALVVLGLMEAES